MTKRTRNETNRTTSYPEEPQHFIFAQCTESPSSAPPYFPTTASLSAPDRLSVVCAIIRALRAATPPFLSTGLHLTKQPTPAYMSLSLSLSCIPPLSDCSRPAQSAAQSATPRREPVDR